MLRCLLTTGRARHHRLGLREELGKWHSEQESKLDTYGLEVSGGYTTTGFLHRISVSYGYIHTSKVDRVITSSALDYMKHKAAATVEFRFLRNRSLTLTGAVYDRNGSYTYYLRNADGSLMFGSRRQDDDRSA